MRRLLAFFLLIGVLLWTGSAYAATSTTLQSAAVADGVGTAATVADVGEVGLEVAITGKATVNFEGSVDGGTTYRGIVCLKSGSTAGQVNNTNNSGIFLCHAPGLSHIRTPVIGWQTGTVTVTANVQEGGGASAGATSTASAPTYVEGTDNNLSTDLSGNLRVTLGTLLSGEDQTNNLLMTSGGVARLTTFSSVTSATSSSVTTVPMGAKTFFGQMINATSETKAFAVTIYGNWTNSTTGAIPVCTISVPSTGTSTQLQDACPPTEANYAYWFYTATVYTSASSAPVTVYAQY